MKIFVSALALLCSFQAYAQPTAEERGYENLIHGVYQTTPVMTEEQYSQVWRTWDAE